ncbi:MAG: HEAT repeat domain-containing protein [Pseudomonadota bacterium]
MFGRWSVWTARWAAAMIRPVEALAFWSLRIFLTRNGPTLFFAAAALLIGTLLALIALAPGPGAAAWTKLSLGAAAMILFIGYIRVYFAVRAETEAALAGLLQSDDATTVSVEDDVTDRITPAPRFPGLMGGCALLVFVLGFTAAFAAISVGLLEGGFGPRAIAMDGAKIQPTPAQWAIFFGWCVLGTVDLVNALPRSGEPLLGVRYEWGWAFAWIIAYRLVLLSIVFCALNAWFSVRRKVAIALSYAGLPWDKRRFLQRLGTDGVGALAAALGDPDPRRREDAALALGAVGASAAGATASEALVQALIRALNDRDEGVRATAARSLGGLSDLAGLDQRVGASTPALIEALADPSPIVRQAAAKSLGSVAAGARETAVAALTALAAALPENTSTSALDWRGLVEAMRSLADLSATLGAAPAAALAAVDKLRGHPDPAVRKEAVEAHGVLDGLPSYDEPTPSLP